MVAFSEEKQSAEFGSRLSDLSDLFRTALLTPVAWGRARKSALNNCLLQPPAKFVRQSKTESWLSKKAEEIQSFADRKDMKKFHDALKTIYGPKRSGATQLLSADESTLLTDKDAILERWAEHFNSVLNRPSSVNDNAISRLPQIECNVPLDEFPTVTETRKAIQHLSSGKASGADTIPAEVYKADGLPMTEKLTELFQCMWRKEAIPKDFKDASIIHLFKRKGNHQVLTTTEVSLSYQLLERYWQKFY